MKIRFPIFILFLALLGGSATATVRAQQTSTPPATGPGARTAASAAPEPVPVNYLLTPNDLLRVQVFQEDDMDWTVRVTKDGTVVLPLVGTVNVNRKTPDALGAFVKDRLHEGYLVHPQVSVTVLEFSKHRFTILGQVQKPGQIDFPDNSNVNVLQAIGMAGGYTRGADAGRVVVKRTVGNREIVLKLDARRMARDPNATPFEILPGDTITVYEVVF